MRYRRHYPCGCVDQADGVGASITSPWRALKLCAAHWTTGRRVAA